MATSRQLTASRANAQHSTGPRTAEGKQASSRNATRHGLTARDLVLSIEERAEYEDLKAALIREHAPQGTLELLMVAQIADAYWRLRRARAIETGLLERELTESATTEMTLAATWEKTCHQLDLLRRYTGAFERSYLRYIAELRRLQADRRKSASFRTGSQEKGARRKEERSQPLQSPDSSTPVSSPTQRNAANTLDPHTEVLLQLPPLSK